MELDEDLIPTKDPGGLGMLDIDLSRPDANLLQQRAVISKLSRDDLEDRFLRILEENSTLKKYASKQEDKLKKLATKLIRVLSEKKRMDSVTGGQGRVRDVETEELLHDQQQRIRELEQQTTSLREKLLVAKNQMVGGPKSGRRSRSNTPVTSQRVPSVQGFSSPSPQHRANCPSQAGSYSGLPSAVQGQVQLLSQQATRLLEEARDENRQLEDQVTSLREQVSVCEQEINQFREQARIKENGLQEEISSLKNQVAQSQRQTVSENIELIRVQRENKVKTSEVQSLKAQLQVAEENNIKLKAEEEKNKSENRDLVKQLQAEQRKNVNITQDINSSVSLKQALAQSQEKLRDVQRENTVLRESNEKLLNSAFDIEKERQYQATENALKVQISQLETTLKSDLNDKKRLTDALAQERESYAQLDSDFQDLQSKFLKLKEDLENQDEKMSYISREQTFDNTELEEAILYLRQKKDMNFVNSEPNSFLERIEDQGRNIESDLTELQVQLVEANNELEKTRNLLRVQNNINEEQKKEIQILQKRIGQIRQEYSEQIAEYQKLLELRAGRIRKLENEIKESVSLHTPRTWRREEIQEKMERSFQTKSNESLFEVHIQRISLSQEALLSTGIARPSLFASWMFYENEQSYTPVMTGQIVSPDSSSFYKVTLDASFLEYLETREVNIQVHLVLENDVQPLAITGISFMEVLDYPNSKLHRTVAIRGIKGSTKDVVLGSMDLWFRLHTNDTRTILQYTREKEEDKTSRIMMTNLLIENNVDFMTGEKERMNEKAGSNRRGAYARKTGMKTQMEAPVPKSRLRAPSQVKNKKIVKKEESVESVESVENPPAVETPIDKTENKVVKDIKQEVIEDKELESKETTKPDQDRKKGLVRSDTFSKSENKKKTKDLTESNNKNDHAVNVDDENKEAILPSDSAVEKNATEPIEQTTSDESYKKSFTTLSKKTSNQLDNIIKNRAKPPRAFKTKNTKISSSTEQSSSKPESVATSEEQSSSRKDPVASPKASESHEETETRISETETTASEGKAALGNTKKDLENKSSSKELETDDHDSEEDSESDTTEGDDDDEDEDASDDDDSEETSDDSVSITTETNPSSIPPRQHKIKVALESGQDSHDSEGVVVEKSTGEQQVNMKENILVVVSDFEAAEDAAFLEDDNVSRLYVEYSLLDVSQDELETPFSLPKPNFGEKITFNFSKVIPFRRGSENARRRALARILRGESEKGRMITFYVVSEPPDSEPELECEEVGSGRLDLTVLDRDLTDHSVQIRDERGDLVGTLTVTVKASSLIKSLNV